MAIEQFELQLRWTKMLTPSVLHLAFARTDGKKLTFIPGQFITFLFQSEGKIARRSYSISNISSEESDEIEIAVSPVTDGLATNILFNLKAGDVLTASGPFGRLILPAELAPQIVLAATGTGVSPYRAMLPTLHTFFSNQADRKVTLLLGVQYRKDLLYLEDFLNFAKAHPQFTFRACLSREAELTSPYEHKGYVQQVFQELNLNPETDLVYLCGNPHMIDEAFSGLVQVGFPTPHVKREKYLSST